MTPLGSAQLPFPTDETHRIQCVRIARCARGV